MAVTHPLVLQRIFIVITFHWSTSRLPLLQLVGWMMIDCAVAIKASQLCCLFPDYGFMKTEHLVLSTEV